MIKPFRSICGKLQIFEGLLSFINTDISNSISKSGIIERGKRGVNTECILKIPRNKEWDIRSIKRLECRRYQVYL